MTPSLLPMPACCSAVCSIISAATSTRPPAPTTAAYALPIPPTPPASRPSPFTPAASSSTPPLWTIPQPTRRILRSLLRSRPLPPRHPQRLLRSKNSPGVSPTTESFQSLSALHIASLLKPASFPFTKHETTDERRPGRPCITITCKNGENISCTANYGLYLIAAAGHQWYRIVWLRWAKAESGSTFLGIDRRTFRSTLYRCAQASVVRNFTVPESSPHAFRSPSRREI